MLFNWGEGGGRDGKMPTPINHPLGQIIIVSNFKPTFKYCKFITAYIARKEWRF